MRQVTKLKLRKLETETKRLEKVFRLEVQARIKRAED